MFLYKINIFLKKHQSYTFTHDLSACCAALNYFFSSKIQLLAHAFSVMGIKVHRGKMPLTCNVLIEDGNKTTTVIFL